MSVLNVKSQCTLHVVKCYNDFLYTSCSAATVSIDANIGLMKHFYYDVI